MKSDFVHHRFEKIAEERPDRIAVEHGDLRVTYGELDRRANAVASWLLRKNLSEKNVVITILPPGPELIAVMLGIFKKGAIYFPVDLNFPAKRLIDIFTLAGDATVITCNSWVENLQRTLSTLNINYLDILCADDMKPDPAANVFAKSGGGADACYIMYTSGSTGEGKGILGSSCGLHHFIDWEINEFAVKEDVRVSQLSQITFDAAFRDIFLPISAGGVVCIPPANVKTNLALLADWIEKSEVNIIHCVPSLFRLLLKEVSSYEGKQWFPHLRQIFMAGEPLYSKDVNEWRKVVGNHVELVNLYGTSETTMAKTCHRIKEVPAAGNHLLHAGKAIEGSAVAIINDGTLCGAGEIGEIYIKTKYPSKGYYKDDSLTVSVFVQNPLHGNQVDIVYKTGDYGRYTEKFDIEVLGRKDRQVKVNGVRVELSEIERAVNSLNTVDHSIIVPEKNNGEETELLCYYTGKRQEEEQLRRQLSFYLSEMMMPAYFIWLAEFPYNINGKIDLKNLPKPERLFLRDADYIPAETPVEKQLERIFARICGVEKIGKTVSFFRLGGTSLKAMQVISRIYHEIGVSILLADVFNNPTVGQLAAVVERKTKSSTPGIIKAPEQEFYEVTALQRRLFLSHQHDETRTVYNMVYAFEVKGHLSLDGLSTAAQLVVDRHESLRTVFSEHSGKIWQKVNSAGVFKPQITVVNLKAHDHQSEAVNNIIEEQYRIAFDLEKGPLFRMIVLELDEHKRIMINCFHHIISDGWSMHVFGSDLVKCYDAATCGRKPDLKPLAIQFRDYAQWLKDSLEGEQMKMLTSFWLKEIDDTCSSLILPSDYPRKGQKSFDGKTVDFVLSSVTSEMVRKTARQHDLSVFMLMVATTNILLSRYSGQRDVIVGVPIAGRIHKELEALIGTFVNFLPLRSFVASDITCIEYALAVKSKLLAMYDHQLYPYDLLLSDLNLKAVNGRLPLINVLVQSQDFSNLTKVQSTSVTVEDFRFCGQTSKVDLTFNFIESGDTITGAIEYDSALFVVDSIQQMIADIETIARAISENPAKLIRQIELIETHAERCEEDEFLRTMRDIN